MYQPPPQKQRRLEASLAQPGALTADPLPGRAARADARGSGSSSGRGARAARAPPRRAHARARARPRSRPRPRRAGAAAPRSRSRRACAPGAPRTPPRRGRRAVVRRGTRRLRTVPESWARIAERIPTRRAPPGGGRGGVAAPRSCSRSSASRSSRPTSRRATTSRGRSSRAGPSASSRACPRRTRSRSTPGSSPRSTGRSTALGRRRPRADRRRRRDGAARARDRDAPRVACGPACWRRSSRRCTRTSSGTTSTSTARSSTGCSLPRSSCSPCVADERRSLPRAPALGAVTGSPSLGNSRLLLLPLVLAAYVAWRVRAGRPRDRRGGARRRRRGAGDRAVGRPQQGAGRVLRDHDRRARALEGEQPDHVPTCSRAAAGSTTCPTCPDVPPWPEKAAGHLPSTGGRRGRRVRAGVVLPRQGARLLARAPGREGDGSRRRPSGCSGSRRSRVTADDAGRQGVADLAQRTAEPVFMMPLYALALVGALPRPAPVRGARRARSSATTRSMAMVFAGTTRYRVPWDFVLALLAAFALERAWDSLRRRRSPAAPSAAS